jgi:hypothetical protein
MIDQDKPTLAERFPVGTTAWWRHDSGDPGEVLGYKNGQVRIMWCIEHLCSPDDLSTTDPYAEGEL